MATKRIRYAVFVPDQPTQLPAVLKWGSGREPWAWGNPDEERMMKPVGVYLDEEEAVRMAIAAWLEQHGDPRTLLATLHLDLQGDY